MHICISSVVYLHTSYIHLHRHLLSDTDECSEGTDNCDANASCTNTLGDYNCTCNTGYEGDGFTCSGTYVHTCKDRYSACNIHVCTYIIFHI